MTYCGSHNVIKIYNVTTVSFHSLLLLLFREVYMNTTFDLGNYCISDRRTVLDCFISNVGIFLTHTKHCTLVTWASNDRRNHRSWIIIPFVHSVSTIYNQGSSSHIFRMTYMNTFNNCNLIIPTIVKLEMIFFHTD